MGTSAPVSFKRFDCDAKNVKQAKEQLVLANRILALEGVLEALGHVSIRNPDNPDTFLQSRSIAPEFVTMDDIIEIALDGSVVVGIEGKPPYGERVLHAAVLETRRDINCVFHGHPLPIIPFSVCKDMPLKPVMNYGAIFYNGFGYFDDSDVSSGTIILSREEGDRVARSLEDKFACILRGHGLVTVAENIPQLIVDTILLIKNAEVQLQIEATGKEPKIHTVEEGRAYRKKMHGENSLVRCWDYYVRRAKIAMGDLDDLEC